MTNNGGEESEKVIDIAATPTVEGMFFTYFEQYLHIFL
jgi:hypothetical protein